MMQGHGMSHRQSHLLSTHTNKIDLDEYLHLAKLRAWIDILFYEHAARSTQPQFGLSGDCDKTGLL